MAVLFIPRRGYFLDYTTFTYSEFVFTYGPFMLTFFRLLFKVTSGLKTFYFRSNSFRVTSSLETIYFRSKSLHFQWNSGKSNLFKHSSSLKTIYFRSLSFNFRSNSGKSIWTNKSLICLFCYWRHIMQIKSVNNILGVICCPELTASCVSAASEMELNLERQTLLNQQRLETII